MLCPTDIHIYRQPLTSEFRIPGLGLFIAGRIAQEVPRRVQEVIADIRFTPSWLRTDRASSIDKAFDCCQGRCSCTRWHPLLPFWQQYGQLIFWYCHLSMLRAIDNRDGRSPITLPADQPIAQSVLSSTLPQAVSFKPGDNSGTCLLRCHSRILSRIDEHPGLYKSHSFNVLTGYRSLWAYSVYGNANRQAHCPGEPHTCL